MLCFSHQSCDLFVTFTISSPGCFLKGKEGGNTNTWILPEPTGKEVSENDWENLEHVRTYSSIFCVGSIMSHTPTEVSSE